MSTKQKLSERLEIEMQCVDPVFEAKSELMYAIRELEAKLEDYKAQNAALLEQVNVARIEELESLLDAWCRWDDGPSRDMLWGRISELKQRGDGK